MDVIENLAEVSFKYIFSIVKTIKEISLDLLLVVEARGFFRQQGGSGQCVRSDLDSPRVDLEMGRSPHYQPICAKT